MCICACLNLGLRSVCVFVGPVRGQGCCRECVWQVLQACRAVCVWGAVAVGCHMRHAPVTPTLPSGAESKKRDPDGTGLFFFFLLFILHKKAILLTIQTPVNLHVSSGSNM